MASYLQWMATGTRYAKFENGVTQTKTFSAQSGGPGLADRRLEHPAPFAFQRHDSARDLRAVAAT